jgi:transcriptional regulator with XRE-family HTH domain
MSEKDRRLVEVMSANVRFYMEQKRISQNELSRRSGENRLTIHRMMHGKVAPTIGTFFRIASALGVTTNDLLPALPEENISKTA